MVNRDERNCEEIVKLWYDTYMAADGHANLVEKVKQYVGEAKKELFEKQDNSGMGAVRAYSDFMDFVIVAIVKVVEKKINITYRGDVAVNGAVIAIGGYGRAELAPFSDLDILFIHKEDEDFSELVKEILYLLWDSGFHVGHSFRQVKECIKIASEDITVLTSLLESRYLYGSGKFVEKLNKSLFKRFARKKIDTYVRTKLAECNKRHKKYENSINLQEPNIKESPGGLRDYHLVYWLGKALLGIGSIEDLYHKKIVVKEELNQLLDAVDFLLMVRNSLHMLSGSRSDVLILDKQTELAERLGFKGDQDRLAVEEFMRMVYLSLNNIYSVSQVVMQRYASPGMSNIFRIKQKIEGLPGFNTSYGKLFINSGSEGVFDKHPSLLLTIFRVCQKKELILSDDLKKIIGAKLHLIDNRFSRMQENIDCFISILTGENISTTLRQMHELRVLGQFVPEFEQLTCHMRFDMYHMFTIDEHIILGIKYLEDLDADFPLKTLEDAYRGLGEDEALKIAFFLHDFGKVVQEKHSIKSAEISEKILKRWRFADDKKDEILFLVKNHLLMSKVAQRSDLHDPDVIADFVAEVENMERLQQLYLLTYADIRSVGHNAWNSWVGMLLEELYMKAVNVILDTRDDDSESKRSKVLKMMNGKNPDQVNSILDNVPVDYLLNADTAKVCRYVKLLMSCHGRKLVVGVSENEKIGYTELMVCTMDMRGVFLSLTGVLTAMGHNILGAQVCTQADGLAVDTLQIAKNEKGRQVASEINIKEFETGLSDILDGRMEMDTYLKKRKSYFSFDKKASNIKTIVGINNSDTRRYSEIQIVAEDRIGLLFCIARALFDMGISVYSAKIATQGHKAIDTFYLFDENEHKIYDEKKIRKLKRTILKSIEDGIPETL